MTTNKDQSVILVLNKMIQCCEKVRELLKSDKEYFAKNNFSTLTESNKNKMAILNQLNTLTNEFLEIKQTYVAEMNPADKTIVQTKLDYLKQEVLDCYKCISTNSSVVFTNLQQLKNVWDTVLAYKENNNNLYDGKGSVNK